MNREILFRAKAINRNPNREYRTNYKNGDWVYGLLTREKDKEYPEICAQMTNTDGISNIDVDMDTLGQFTGKTDKNGNKIFEGDIVEYEFDEIGKQKAIIYWNFDYAGFLLNPLDNFQFTRTEDGRVIGNIYDNPELLGGNK